MSEPTLPANTAAPVTTEAAIDEAVVGAGTVIVAVHGMGDEFRQDTVQAVFTAFARHHRYRPAVFPLGQFHSPDGDLQAFRVKHPPNPANAALEDIGFVEVYWADLPRDLQKEGHTIEESKAWARTVVERVRARAEEVRSVAKMVKGQSVSDAQVVQMLLQRVPAATPGSSKSPQTRAPLDYLPDDADLTAAADAVEEMLETIQVLGRLLFLAGKAGLPRFDLDNLLTTFLGDVQVVSEFANQREQILQRFDWVLHRIRLTNSTANVHVVAHSEGSVVAFAGLLRALAGQSGVNFNGQKQPTQFGRPRWIDQVRGLMTFGSPIDKHMVLWPEMWNGYKSSPAPSVRVPIHWRNYYDFGDPVGFELDTARDWVGEHLPSCFRFPKGNDHGFSRYLLPGWAHLGYWSDEKVFGHYIEHAVSAQAPADGETRWTPASRTVCRLAAYVLPYALVFLLHAAAVYLLWRALAPFLVPAPLPTVTGLVLPLPAWDIPWPPSAALVTLPAGARAGTGPGYVAANVLGITALLFGATAGARILRLTRGFKYFPLALLAYAAGAAAYVLVVCKMLRFRLGFGALMDSPDPFWPTVLLLGLGFGLLLLSLLARGLANQQQQQQHPS